MDYPFEFYMQAACFMILALAFLYGALKLFRKGVPMYFQLYVIACGCRMLEHLIGWVVLLCGAERVVFTATDFFAGLSFSMFILSANRGVFDGIVDDHSNPLNKKARILAFIAPLVLFTLLFATCFIYSRFESVPAAVFLFISMLPNVPASYYCLKHLLMPEDEFGFLKATRKCNIAVLLFMLIYSVYGFVSFIFPWTWRMMIVEPFIYLFLVYMVISAVKGADLWNH